MNSKSIKDLNVRPDTIKLLEDNIGRDTHIGRQQYTFLGGLSPKVKEIKAKVNK